MNASDCALQLDSIPIANGNGFVVRDDLLAGGTKQRAIVPFVEDRKSVGYCEFVYASPFSGFAQVALASAIASTGIECVLFAERTSTGTLHRFSEKACEMGAMVIIGSTMNAHFTVQFLRILTTIAKSTKFFQSKPTPGMSDGMSRGKQIGIISMKLASLTFVLSFGILIGTGVEAETFKAVYMVPVAGAPDAASNLTTAAITRTSQGSITLVYALPEDLVGHYDKPIAMTLVSQAATPTGFLAKFKDQIGWSLCAGQTWGLACTSEYDKLPVDQAEVHEVLQNKYSLNPNLLAAKTRAAATFSTDPIGVLQIFCSTPSCGLCAN